MTAENAISIEDFKAEMIKDLDLFIAAYKKDAAASETPEYWPREMGEGEWFDQFLMHLNGA